MILKEFIGNPVPPVIGFGYLVMVQRMVNARCASNSNIIPGSSSLSYHGYCPEKLRYTGYTKEYTEIAYTKKT